MIDRNSIGAENELPTCGDVLSNSLYFGLFFAGLRRQTGRRRSCEDDNPRGSSLFNLLKGATRSDRGDIVIDIFDIVRQAAYGELPEQPDPFDDEAPGG